MGPPLNVEDVLDNEKATLFWVPMLFKTAKQAENLIEEMLDLIQDFEFKNQYETESQRRSVLDTKEKKRRQQIIGEKMNETEIMSKSVDVVSKSEETRVKLQTVLHRHFLFNQLRDYELEDVIDVMRPQYVSEGDVIIEQGAPDGDLFYILEEGQCEIIINDESLGYLESGSSFGDLALLYNCPRAATIVAASDCSLWTLDRIFFRQAIMISSSNQSGQLTNFLSKINLFEKLGDQNLAQLARSLTKQSYEDGQYIIRQGDIGEQFYLIYKGTVNVTMTDDSGNEKFLINLEEGQFFGERALIKKEPRKANIVANGPVECYYLDSSDFYQMLGEFVDNFNKVNEMRIIKSSSLFQHLNDTRLKELLTMIDMHRMFSGQRLVCDTNSIILVMNGTFEDSYGKAYSVESNAGAEIGSTEEGADQVAGALTAITEEGLLAVVSRDALLGLYKANEEDETNVNNRRRASTLSLEQGKFNPGGNNAGESGDSSQDAVQQAVAKRIESAHMRTSYMREHHGGLCDLTTRVGKGLEQLEVLHAIGKGSFGTVYLSREVQGEGSTVVLKCLDRKALMENGQAEYVKREVSALRCLHDPFIASYYGTILSPNKVMLLLEYISGGELWTLLYEDSMAEHRSQGEFGGLKIEDAVKYSGCVLLALSHVHELGFCYRDLKPENLLIGHDGYIKLVDFGFAKEVPYLNPQTGNVHFRTYTLCGTPEYMAPELVLTQGHDRSADYWAFGVLVYELLVGNTPFESSKQQRIFEKIVHSQKHLSFTADFDPHCKSLIRRLLHPNAALRIGALQNGVADITSHAFFRTRDLSFERLHSKELSMPYVPGEKEAPPISIDVEPLDLEFEAAGVGSSVDADGVLFDGFFGEDPGE